MSILTRDLVYAPPGKNGQRVALLRELCLTIPTGSFTAIVGPSGCGKSTLLKVLAGLLLPTAGGVMVGGSTPGVLRESLPLAIGYLPQFAAFHDELTVREALAYAIALRLPSAVGAAEREAWLLRVAELAGLQAQIHQQVATLSGGQKRRLALAEELIGDPSYLFLDELTSGLDPHSERSMMLWLAELSQKTGKTIVLVTHAVNNLAVCDQVVFLNAGQLMYAGPPVGMLEYFGEANLEDVYQHIEHFLPVAPGADVASAARVEPSELKATRPPGGLAQIPALVARQARLLWRDKGQLWLQVLLLLSFPGLVAVFALNGLPEVRRLSMRLQTNVIENLAERLQFLSESFHVSSLVAGLSMFQVILLTLMGANNSSREIAKERLILAKELRAGLSPFAYLSSKAGFVLFFSLLQAGWMTVFVKTMCGFPGTMTEQFTVLFLATLAMSCTCLWFSAISKTPERASLLSIYLVGLQLPLSGAVLALPLWLKWLTRPFIAAYWGWSGYLRTFEDFRHFDIVKQTTKTDIANYNMSVIVLSAHVVVMLVLTFVAIHRKRSESGA